MNALGLIEVIGLPCAIDAADAAAKAASVKILGMNKIGSGMITISIMGDVGAVESAVQAGEQSAKRIGKVLYTHVIPRADSQLISKKVISMPEENGLSVKTNSELKNMILEKGLSEEKDLKYLKKDELIDLLENGKEENNGDM